MVDNNIILLKISVSIACYFEGFIMYGFSVKLSDVIQLYNTIIIQRHSASIKTIS